MKKPILKTLLGLLPSLLSFCLSSCGASGYQVEEVSNQGGSAFYEIFVGSFCDSNGDGTGDLNGITSKLDYLEDLGVSYLWLTPIHQSPTYHKYDVVDYYSIDSKFGTMDDFDNLIKKADEHHIGIIMDMVFNHCSVTSSWFSRWCSAHAQGKTGNEYYNDFSYSDTAATGYNYIDLAGCYVESRFSETMPEFNIDSKHVRSEFDAIQTFWLNKGVAGFRYDAVLYYYYGETSKNAAFMKTLVSAAQAVKSDVYQVGECWVSDENVIAAYSASGMHCFNFPTSENASVGTVGYVGYSSGLKAFVDKVVDVASTFKEAGAQEPVFFVSNHDQDRWGGYYSGRQNELEKRKLVASCYLLTPGTPFLYYGEEIQMRGIRSETDGSDFARRQAMVWGEGEAMCKQPESKTFKNQVTSGVKEELADSWSMLNHYRKVLSIRNKHNDLFEHGDYQALSLSNDGVAGFKIAFNGENYYLIHSNSSSSLQVAFSASSLLEDIPTGGSSSSFSNGSLTIAPFSTVLLK